MAVYIIGMVKSTNIGITMTPTASGASFQLAMLGRCVCNVKEVKWLKRMPLLSFDIEIQGQWANLKCISSADYLLYNIIEGIRGVFLDIASLKLAITEYKRQVPGGVEKDTILNVIQGDCAYSPVHVTNLHSGIKYFKLTDTVLTELKNGYITIDNKVKRKVKSLIEIPDVGLFDKAKCLQEFTKKVTERGRAMGISGSLFMTTDKLTNTGLQLLQEMNNYMPFEVNWSGEIIEGSQMVGGYERACDELLYTYISEDIMPFLLYNTWSGDTVQSSKISEVHHRAYDHPVAVTLSPKVDYDVSTIINWLSEIQVERQSDGQAMAGVYYCLKDCKVIHDPNNRVHMLLSRVCSQPSSWWLVVRSCKVENGIVTLTLAGQAHKCVKCRYKNTCNESKLKDEWGKDNIMSVDDIDKLCVENGMLVVMGCEPFLQGYQLRKIIYTLGMRKKVQTMVYTQHILSCNGCARDMARSFWGTKTIDGANQSYVGYK